jgi:SET domain-containing protein
MFATKKINKGDIIEVCPALIEKTKHLQYTDKLKDYYFEYDIDNSLIGLGYCSMYNHSDSPNAEWLILDKNSLKIKALENIEVGEEIFVSYGDDYWKHRKELQKK